MTLKILNRTVEFSVTVLQVDCRVWELLICWSHFWGQGNCPQCGDCKDSLNWNSAFVHCFNDFSFFVSLPNLFLFGAEWAGPEITVGALKSLNLLFLLPGWMTCKAFATTSNGPVQLGSVHYICELSILPNQPAPLKARFLQWLPGLLGIACGRQASICLDKL